MKILTLNKGETFEYSATELKKYIVAMSSGSINPEIIYGGTLSDIEEGNTILLGTLDTLGLDTSDLTDPVLEDIIDVKVNGLSGYISGSNPRSVLMGVYKYCHSAGCRFIRPGADGDYVPAADLPSHSFEYRKKADKLFRGECCEGAISYEHMRDTVYWLPKIGMNMYMIEGMVPYTYMHKWYGHVWNKKLRIPGQITDYEMLKRYVNMLERDVNRTGVQLHTLGHGWMFEKLGVRHESQKAETESMARLTEEQMQLFAEVGGKRGLYQNSSFYTHFCYSNPKARKLLVDTIVDYAKDKPHVDFIHTWLADSSNNQCECSECIKKTPSDWYVVFLNELDEELTRLGSGARIVFILYVDTVRPPELERLKNPSRFVILTAIGGFYEQGYVKEEYKGEIPPFVRNRFTEAPAALRLKWHSDWKEMSGGIPSIIYEYRYYVDMYVDLSQMQICRETYRDMLALDDVDFNGCMSDQTHRMYMPTSLPLITMGATLFDRDTDFEELKSDYFRSAFGDGAESVREYLDILSELASPSSFRKSKDDIIDEDLAGVGEAVSAVRCWKNNPTVKERAEKIPAHLDAFLPTIRSHIASECDPARRLSWIYLGYHSEITRIFSRILAAGAGGDLELAKTHFSDLEDYLSEHELEFHGVFDVFLFLRAVGLKIGVRTPPYYA